MSQKEVHKIDVWVDKAEENGTWIAWLPLLGPFSPVGKGKNPEAAVASLKLRLTRSYKR